MAAQKRRARSNTNGTGVSVRVGRLETGLKRFESAQRDTNARLGRIEETLITSSKLFELMHERLEHLERGQQALVEGQQALVEGQQALVEGQKQVVERLDRLVAASTRDRTEQIERIARLEQRVDVLERRQ
jgi:uncharacterized phage infection (PIP) family protein YhgE